MTELILICLSPFMLIGAVFVLWMVNAAQKSKKREQMRLEEEKRIRALRIADVDYMDGIEFEHYVCRLLIHLGFKAEVTQASGDFGVDIISSKGDLKYAVQVKRYNNAVSRRAVSDAVAGRNVSIVLGH